MDKVMITTGEMVFTESNQSILGKIVEGTEEQFLGLFIRKRRMPKLDDNFQPTNEYYGKWEIVRGNQSWFLTTKIEAYVMAMELWGKATEGKEG